MSLSILSPADPLPRFRQIFDHLRDEIAGGGLREHAALPSERTVAETHGVSRMTARRALEALEAEGLAYSEGRRGRFVSPNRVRFDISNRVSFAADAKASGIALDIEVIEKKTTIADTALSAALCVDQGEELYEYTRLFRTNGHTTFIETEFLIAKRFPGFLSKDLRQSSTRLLEDEYDTTAKTGDIVIRMHALHENEAALLGLAPHSAAIELEQVIGDAAGAPFCFGRQIWRGELAEFSAKAMVNQ